VNRLEMLEAIRTSAFHALQVSGVIAIP